MNQFKSSAKDEVSNKTKKPKKNISMVQLLVVSFILISVVAAVLGVGSTPSDSVAEQEVYTPTGTEAFITAQYYVTSVLKSPKTADFPSNEYNHNIVGGETHVVTSYVDSENSFGALLRSTWTASMKFNGGNWADVNNWTLQSLVVDGEEVYMKPE